MSLPRRLRSASLAAALSLLTATTGCGVVGARGPDADGVCALPAEVVATLVSAAIGQQLGYAAPSGRDDPRGYAAPVRVTPDGYAVTFEQGPGRRWLPRADQLLTLRGGALRGGVQVDRRPLPEDAPAARFGLRRQGTLEVLVTRRGEGCCLQQNSSRAHAPTARAVIERTLQLLASPNRGGPGADEPNFLMWRLGDLLTRAAQCERDDVRSALLRAALRIPGAPSALYEQLAEHLIASGDEARAVAYLQRAARTNRDPMRRAALGRMAHALRSRIPGNARGDALTELGAGDLGGCELLLHSARRDAPQPALDYRLLGALHRARGEEAQALAAELLAREYEQAARTNESAPLAEPRGLAGDPSTGWSARRLLAPRTPRRVAEGYPVRRPAQAPPRR